jgi:tetratricopeptide (TPR) repeat protein
MFEILKFRISNLFPASPFGLRRTIRASCFEFRISHAFIYFSLLLASTQPLISAEIANDRKNVTIDERLRLADGLSKRGHYALAIDEYMKILEQFPNDPLTADALAQIADAYSTSGNLDKALEKYKLFLLKFPRIKTTDAVKVNYAAVLLKIGGKENETEALSILTEMKKSNECTAMVHDAATYNLAKYHGDSGDSMKAKAEFMELSSRKISSGDDIYAAFAKIELASILDSEGKTAEAASLLKSLIDSKDTPPEILCPALNYLAAMHFREKEYLAASETYEQLWLLFPDSAAGKEAYYKKYESLFHAKEYLTLVRGIDRVLEKSDRTVDSTTEILVYLKGSAQMELASYKDAAHTFSKIINSPSTSTEYISKSSLQTIKCLLLQDRIPEAVKEAGELLKRDKMLSLSKVTATEMICSALKKPFEKIAFMKETIGTAHDVKERNTLRLALARLYVGLSQPDNALSLYRDILSDCENEFKPSCYFGIAKISETAGNENEAIECYRKVTTEFPESPLYPEALLKCAILMLYEKSNYGESREILLKLIKDYSGNRDICGNALFYIAYMDFSKGSFLDAFETFKKISEDGKYDSGLRFLSKQYLLWSFLSANMMADTDRLFLEISSSPENLASVNPELLLLLGKKYDEKERPEYSLKCYQALAKNNNPDYRIRALTNLGLMMEKKGDNDKALAFYRDGEKIKTENTEAYSELLSRLGTALIRKGNRNEAVLVFEKCIGLSGGDSASDRSRIGLAKILSDSEEDLTRANRYAMSVFILSKDPSLSEEAIILSIEISLKQNKKDEARATFEELKKRFPKSLKKDKVKNLQTLLK